MSNKINIKELIIISLFSVILYIQELVLVGIPNVSLTICLIIVYSKVLKVKKTLLIILIYTFLDNLTFGSLNLLYLPFMLIGWSLIPIFTNTLFIKIESSISLAFLGILFSLIYCWLFIIPNIFITKIDIVAYIIADIPFEIILSLSSFISILWLYAPLKKVLESIVDNNLIIIN